MPQEHLANPHQRLGEQPIARSAMPLATAALVVTKPFQTVTEEFLAGQVTEEFLAGQKNFDFWASAGASTTATS